MAINVNDVGNAGGWEPNFKPNCEDGSVNGIKSARFDYILKSVTPDYPDEACTPYLHGNAQIDNLQVNQNETIGGNLDVTGNITAAGNVTAPTFKGNLQGVASGNKLSASFDIPHVKDKGRRIRHIVAEGPEPGIYIRGQLKDKNVIELPEYWDGLIDPETITVTLTQIGYSQDLIVDKIEWGRRILIRSGNGANINCFYEVWAARWLNPMNHDEKLNVVYEGRTPDDYPGGNENFLIGGWDYDRRNPQWEGG